MLFGRLMIFFKIKFFKKLFHEVRKFPFVEPDLDAKCLQRLSADDTSRQIVECAHSMFQKKINFS